MQYDDALIEGTLIRRYKRFLADVSLPDGREITAHTPNTGSMMGCNTPGCRVWLRDSGNPERKHPLSWEMIEVAPGTLVGINTSLSNALVREAIETGVIEELQGYRTVRSEVRYGQENSRIDLLLQNSESAPDCYVEVKNVTLADNGVGYFPDAVSARGTKHLRELTAMVEAGYRAALCFCVQRADVTEMAPADHIDPEYGKTLREAAEKGVEMLAYRATVTPERVELVTALPVVYASSES